MRARFDIITQVDFGVVFQVEIRAREFVFLPNILRGWRVLSRAPELDHQPTVGVVVVSSRCRQRDRDCSLCGRKDGPCGSLPNANCRQAHTGESELPGAVFPTPGVITPRVFGNDRKFSQSILARAERQRNSSPGPFIQRPLAAVVSPGGYLPNKLRIRGNDRGDGPCPNKFRDARRRSIHHL